MFKVFTRTLVVALLLGASVFASAKSLNQAAWVPNTDTYRFGYNSIPNIKISGAPSDTDYNRSAMLHDGSVYRLYFFKRGSSDTIYQFGWNGRTYQYGYKSIPKIKLTGKPRDANPQDFAMLHDGTTYRLYMLNYNQTKVYQFGWNGSTYKYGHNSIPSIQITGAPRDTDKNRWAMLHDGSTYRMYFGKNNTIDKLYQFAWNGSSYKFGYKSIDVLDLDRVPGGSDFDVMNMLHDGSNYRFYYLAN